VTKWLAPLGLLFTWALTLFAYLRLPERIPAHWNLRGEVTRYGAREEVFLLPLLLTLLIYPLLHLAPRMDPKLQGKALGAWPWLTASVVWTFALLQGAILYAIWQQAQGAPVPVGQVLMLVLALLFLALAPLLPRLPPNHLAGVRTLWTLADPGVWRATHRLAGWVFALLGLLALGVGLGWVSPLVWLAALLVGVLYLVLFSYLAWRNTKNPGP
jgi:uncharacterized membrane protein